MAKKSAGILLVRRKGKEPEVFLVHMGGPFWQKKDDGAWSIPKGEPAEGEDPLEAARREFTEETGAVLDADFVELQPVRQAGGKIVLAWMAEGDLDAGNIRSNFFTMEWPPRSGNWQAFPEVDRAAWFDLQTARRKILKSQLPLLDQLLQKLNAL